MSTPLLSIGIIFRDDIRSIEHCLKALQPLRDAIPCQLVMADTGSTDGSREVAEKYADILIDFPWINDFAAARNAVMDECTGKWYLTVDTDEYLSEKSDLKELTDFFDRADIEGRNLGTVDIRNHSNYELNGDYSDFLATRLLRMSLGVRYHGAVHEQWRVPSASSRASILPHIIFDHDGYVEFGSNSEKGRKKRERNMTLLREKLKQDPKSLLIRLQVIESGAMEPDFVDQIRSAVRMVKRKVDGWDDFGPPIMRYAVNTAEAYQLPEFDEWVALAQRLFPQSMFIRLDIEYALIVHSWDKKDYADCVERGERYLKAIEDFNAGADPTARVYSVLKMATPIQVQGVKIILANACINDKKAERALELLSELDYGIFNGKQTMDLVKTAQVLHFRSNLDTAPLICAAWEGICEPKPSQKQADHRKGVFNWCAAQAFVQANRKKEQGYDDFCRDGYTLYLPLKGKNEIGNAAAIMELEDAESLDGALRKVENWEAFPIEALGHALECGVRFPLVGMPMAIEDLEQLTKRLTQEKEEFDSLALQQTERVPDGWQELIWVRSLAIAAVRTFDWERKSEGMKQDDVKKHQEQGLSFARGFARIEEKFICRYYTEDTRSEDNIYILPPMHRFGWYCAKAFRALDTGNRQEYIKQLKMGLSAYKDAAKMVEFLLDHTPELQEKPEPSAELKALADQIRAVLANFSPDDPAVVALKQSEAYQKVAYLIEGIEAPIVGGLKQ